VSLITFGILIHDAEAKRFGGGRSFGVSRSASSFSRPNSGLGQNYSQSQRLGQTASPMSRWLGPLAGLAAGGLLASLFMSNGLGSGILSWLLVGGLFLVLFTLIRGKMQPKPYYKQDNQNNFAREASANFMNNNSRSYSAAVNNYPLGFDADSFLRDAKLQFIRLQAAYDQKNLQDIREFTSPEVFAEIQLQLQEQGNVENKTDVVSLQAELLDVATESQMISGADMQSMVASVRFNGLIQEDRNEPAASINEVWHFKKDVASLRWIVAGVQQA
jgi:predicted lipid-binding transport protein (Tim44 family)